MSSEAAFFYSAQAQRQATAHRVVGEDRSNHLPNVVLKQSVNEQRRRAKRSILAPVPGRECQVHLSHAGHSLASDQYAAECAVDARAVDNRVGEQHLQEGLDGLG